MNEFISTVYKNPLACAVGLALTYGFLAAWAGWHLRQNAALTNDFKLTAAQNGWQRWALYACVLFHTGLLAYTVWLPQPQGGIALALGFAEALSLATCVGMWVFAIEERWVNLFSLRPLALLLPAFAVVLAATVPSTPVTMSAQSATHVVCAIAAHGMALLCAGHALLIWGLDASLRRSQSHALFDALVRHCPPLVVLERLLLSLVGWVIALLTATVVLGAWAGVLRLDHKTVLTVLSLLAWCGVWWGYHQRTWRGRTLTWAVWGATALLLLSYIGSRFVLQAILHRV